jgi:DNA mismatch repair protein MutS
MQEFTTPMMVQYQKIKNEYKDCLLFFRLGDFYELFLDDAKIGSEVLDITLTSRPRGKDGKIPMAGVPYHAVDNYIGKLIKAGYKVAICEQVSEPDKYGIVEREVIRVITPGTVLDEKMLEKKENNYLITLATEANRIAIAYADISTRHIEVVEKETENIPNTIRDELIRISPSECILSNAKYNDYETLKLIKTQKGVNVFPFHNWEYYENQAKKFLKNHFKIKSLEIFNIENNPLSQIVVACLIGYLKETQKNKIDHIKKIMTLDSEEFVSIDRSTFINLELFSTIREHETRGTVLSVLDHTQTAMGARLLKIWMKQPLRNKTEIEKRLDAVEEFTKNHELRKQIKKRCSEVHDVERTLSRLSVGIGNARDMILLKESLSKIIQIKHKLVNCKKTLNQKNQKKIQVSLLKVIKLIETTIKEEPAISIKDGGIIKENINEKLDKLRMIIGNGKEFISDLEKKERERTNINSLKVRFNKVFGFYIEVSKANVNLVPKNFVRKQTLVNAERFITDELKSHEEIILSSEIAIKEMEYEIYLKTLKEVLSYTKQIQKAAEAIAETDCVINFAELAIENHYVRPKILYSGEIKIKKGRHPVVEKLLEEKEFVPNDVCLDNITQQLLLITGPNMAGKSVYIRQVAIIILMAHIGSFVPAQTANISIVDKIFVRSGASDAITSGLSTFMVEMVETAYILNHATSKSLIIMDEIGRGTSTYDGISIAWAIAEYIVTKYKVAPKTLFATHYHELQKLEEIYPKKISNYHMAIEEKNNEPIFLHTVMKGAASHSFGVAVARLAGVPEEVISNAYKMLHTLEIREEYTPKKTQSKNNEEIITEISSININNTTPMDALQFLEKIKNKYGKN